MALKTKKAETETLEIYRVALGKCRETWTNYKCLIVNGK